VTRLTNDPALDHYPQWSPNGARIAFDRGRDFDTLLGTPEIYVMNADGSNVVRLTNNTIFDGGVVWSPDNTRLVFDSGADIAGATSDLYAINASNGGNPLRLTNTDAQEFVTSWRR
jgi:TolB protein